MNWLFFRIYASCFERENGFIIENETFIIDNSTFIIENEHFIIKSQNAIFKNILLLLIQITYHHFSRFIIETHKLLSVLSN